ncbi:MAG: IS200/IS605 family transposase [Proteobacteria bacterium]|nr:IS200/IS605 family transposase [Pseudomonadota bacterium]
MPFCPAHELRGLEKGTDKNVKLFATRHSHAVLYVHVVWATKNRAAVLDSALLFRLSRQAADTAHALGSAVLALGGAPDHVHLLVRYRPDLSVAELVRGLKAALTLTIRREVSSFPDFSWQTGYGAFSVSSSELDRTVAYISNQERHHAAGTIWPDLELED